ncbi:MAG: hypothetical protein QW680_11395 [Pyrobaculum sp.]
MKAFLLNTFSVGTLWWGVLGEPTDRASYPLIICVRSGGRVVTSQQMVYDGWGFDPPVKTTYIDISGLSDGEYEVTIENNIGCNGQFIMGRWYILLNKSALSIVFNGASQCRSFAAVLYNNRLYYWYGEGCTAFVHPGSTALVEFVDSVGNGYVNLKTWNAGELVNPNVKVPFMASFDIEFSGDVRSIMSMINIPGHKIAYEIIGSNKLRVYILKDGPGLPVVAVIAIAAVVVAGIFAVGYTINAIGNLVVKTSASQMLNDIRNAFNTATLNLQNELAQCTDEQCRAGAYSRYITTIDSLSSLLGQVSVMTGEQQQRCDGVKIGNTCIPWWVLAVGVAILLLLLTR